MLNQDYKEMLSLLLEEQVEFVLVGAYAMAAHGYPRATGDIDLYINPSAENSQRVYNCLARFGAPMDELRPDEFSTPDVVFQIGIAPRRIDMITMIDGVTFKEASEDALEVDIEGLRVPVLSKSNLIRNKESTGRPKDQIDAEMLKASQL